MSVQQKFGGFCFVVTVAFGGFLPGRAWGGNGNGVPPGPDRFPPARLTPAADPDAPVSSVGTAATGEEQESGPLPAPPKDAPKAEGDKPIPWPWTPVPKLRPVDGGPGILVCEPMAVHADRRLAEFGTGASRWLHLVIGGNAKLGSTPHRWAADRARAELGRKDLRLGRADARKLYRILGITHVALGTVTGSARRAKLTYRLYTLPRLRAVGAPVTLAGSEAQLSDGLPALARELGALLKVGPLDLPDRTGLRPLDFEFLGRLPWQPERSPSPARYQRLMGLASRTPLAGIYMLYARKREDLPGWTNTLRFLYRRSGENVLVLGEIGGVMGFPSYVPQLRARIDELRRKYPSNYILATCEFYRQRAAEDGNPAKEHRVVEDVVRFGYRNPEAWLYLAWTIGDEADRVRHGRFASRMSWREWEFLNRVYPQWLAAAYRAARTDPDYAWAWERVAEAGTFAGETDLADRAFWRAIGLRWENRYDRFSLWWWGMEMYQPKWGGDPAKLVKVARRTVDEFWYDQDTIYVFVILRRVGQPWLAAKLERRMIRALLRTPDDVWSHYIIAFLHRAAGRKREAMREFRTVLRTRPNQFDSHFLLARYLRADGRIDEAIREYRAALRGKPKDPSAPDARNELARLEKLKRGERVEGESAAGAGRKDGPAGHFSP